MPLSIATQRDGLLQTLEVRRGLEVEASMLAAKRASDADIEAMRAALDAMEAEHLEFGTAGQADLVYHLSIYKASGNPLFEQLLGQMREAFESFFAQPFNRPDFAKESFEFHRMLFDAIVARDPEAARQHTLAILEIVENDIVRMSNEQQ
nr:FCD domain-containing protein [Thalassospira xiamenensis]